jgi:hypothetical protein
MKNAAAPTTTTSGAAVNSSRMTAVQSVYIDSRACARPLSQLGWLAALALALAAAVPARADVVFENCQPSGDGGITCDTRPTGDTLMDDEAARYGLFQQASPGWNEFEPYQGDDEMFGGNET